MAWWECLREGYHGGLVCGNREQGWGVSPSRCSASDLELGSQVAQQCINARVTYDLLPPQVRDGLLFSHVVELARLEAPLPAPSRQRPETSRRKPCRRTRLAKVVEELGTWSADWAAATTGKLRGDHRALQAGPGGPQGQGRNDGSGVGLAAGQRNWSCPPIEFRAGQSATGVPRLLAPQSLTAHPRQSPE